MESLMLSSQMTSEGRRPIDLFRGPFTRRALNFRLFLVPIVCSLLMGSHRGCSQQPEPTEAVQMSKSKLVELAGEELESELAIVPSNEEETARLQGPERVFADFCLGARDMVLGDIKRSLTELVAKVFRLFLGPFERLGLNLSSLDASKEASAAPEPTTASSLPDTGIPHLGEALTQSQPNEDQPENSMATQEDAATTNGPLSGFLRAIMAAVSAIKSALASAFLNQLSQLKRTFGSFTLRAALGTVCNRAGFYLIALESKFKKLKGELLEAGGPLAEQLDWLDRPQRLDCVTLSRLSRLHTLCKMGASVQSHPLTALLTSAKST